MSVSTLIPFDLSFNLKENTTFTQYAYDISGAESGGLAGHSISKNLAGDIIAVGAPLNSGGGTARGEVRVYQKDNDSWLQLGNDLNGEADNEEFGHSLDLNGDGTILAVGTKDLSNNTLVYKYDSGSWGLYGNTIKDNVNIEVNKTSALTKPKLNKTGDKLSILKQYEGILKIDPIKTFSGNIEIKGSLFTGGTMYGDKALLSYDGNTMLTGGRKNSDTVSTEGSIEVYTWNGTSWTPKGDFIYGGVSNGLLGRDAGLNGDGNIFCAGLQNTTGFYVYEWSGTSWGLKGNTLSKQYWCCDINYSGNRFVAIERYNATVNVWEYNDTTNTWDDITSNLNNLSAILINGQNASVTINKSSDSSIDGTVISTCQSNTTKVFYYDGSTWSQRGGTISTSYNTGDDVKQHSLNHDGTLVAIGCSESNNSVDVYEWNGTSWGKKGQTITSADITNNSLNLVDTQRFGISVSLSSNGSYLAVSGVGVFEYNGSAWVQVSNTFGSEMTQSNSNEDKIQISGDGSTIVIGLEQAAQTAVYTYENIVEPSTEVTKNNGFVQSYQYSESDASWNYLGDKIESASVNDISGGDIAINDEGNMIAIGYPQTNSATGTTKVYKYDTSWNQVGSNIDGSATGDHAGTSVVIDGSGDFVAIGSPFAGDASAGEVNVYQNVSDTWTLYGNKIEGQSDNDEFGSALDMTPAGNILAVGAPNANAGKGNINIYQYNETDSSWNQLGGDLSGAEVGDLTGTSVKLNQTGTEVSVGEPQPSNATLFWYFASTTSTMT